MTLFKIKNIHTRFLYIKKNNKKVSHKFIKRLQEQITVTQKEKETGLLVQQVVLQLSSSITITTQQMTEVDSKQDNNRKFNHIQES